MKKLVLRADGNPEIGLGHLYRLKAIGEYFEAKSEITFLTKDTVVSVITSNWEVIQLDNQNELEFIKHNFSSDSTVFVLDGYQFDAEYQQQLKENGFEFMFIDDFHSFSMIADVVINPSISVAISDYTGDSRLGLGAGFAPLRPEFLEISKKRIDVKNNEINKVFISLGGTDFYNLSEKIIKEIDKIESIAEVHLMVGNSYENQELLESEFNFNLTIHKGLEADQIIQLVRSCDLAISSASTISYEICSCQIPLIVGWYADNQIDLYNGLVEKGLAEGVGNLMSISSENLHKSLIEIFAKKFDDQIHQQQRVFNGFNKENLYSFILPLLSELELRNAESTDVQLYFDWANDKVVRANSLSPEKIVFANHEKWFSGKIESNDSHLYLAELNGENIGQLRFDLVEDNFEIDYSIDAKHRGKGFGTELIACGIYKLRKQGINQKIRAKVKKSNKASSAVFQKLGFQAKGFTETEGMLIFDYHL